MAGRTSHLVSNQLLYHFLKNVSAALQLPSSVQYESYDNHLPSIPLPPLPSLHLSSLHFLYFPKECQHTHKLTTPVKTNTYVHTHIHGVAGTHSHLLHVLWCRYAHTAHVVYAGKLENPVKRTSLAIHHMFVRHQTHTFPSAALATVADMHTHAHAVYTRKLENLVKKTSLAIHQYTLVEQYFTMKLTPPRQTKLPKSHIRYKV